MMSQSRFASMHNGLSIAAKAIYEAVPIAEPWSIGSILAELQRTGVSMEIRTLVGCLNRMVEAGIVNEPQLGFFIRAPIRSTPTPKPTPEPFNHPRTAMSSTAAPQVIAQVVKTVVSPLDKLGELAQRVGQITMLAKTLADDMTNVAIEVQEQFEAANTDNAKLTVRWCDGYAFAYRQLRRGHSIIPSDRRTGAYAQGVDAALEDQGQAAIRRAVMVRGVHRVVDSQGILE